MESKKDLYVAQSRCLKDEVSTIKSEIRERKDRIEKLKIRHEHTVKAMGETKKVRKNMYIPICLGMNTQTFKVWIL